MRLSDVSGVKVLGRAIGSPGKPSEFDGDGDGFLTGPDGRDNVPAPKEVVERIRHAGSRFLDLFDSHEKAMTEKFGDLRDADNVRRAVKQTFPNLVEFEWLDKNQKTLNDVEHARVVALLHLGQDKKTAGNLTVIGWLGEDRRPGLYASVSTGIDDDEAGPRFIHALRWNKDMPDVPDRVNDRMMIAVDGGWGDKVAYGMTKDGVPKEEIARFWAHYLMHHEWTHVEHMGAAFKKMGMPFSTDARKFIKSVAVLDGVNDEDFDKMIKDATDARRLARPNESAEDLKHAVTRELLQAFDTQVRDAIGKGMNDDLTWNELKQFNEDYSRTVSGYAATNFRELVAEKGSAARLGLDLGADIPPWRKFKKWLYNTDAPGIDTTGMSRQQRRALERELTKKKDAKSDFLESVVKGVPKPFKTTYVDTCEDFGKHSRKDTKKKSLSDILSIKFLR